MIRFCLMLLGWLLADLLFWWAADSQLKRLPARRLWRTLLALFVGIQMLYILNTFIHVFVDDLANPTPLTLHVAAYLWHLVWLPVAILGICILRIATGIGHLAARRRSKKPALSPSASSPRLEPAEAGAPIAPRFTRRNVLLATAAAIPPFATVAMSPGAVGRLAQFRTQRLEIHLPTLPLDLDGLTIAHVTDLHIGRFLAPGMIERVAEATNALAADLVVFTGDLNDITQKQPALGIDFIRRLDPRHGLAIIEGNHDVSNGLDEYEQPMRDAGLPLLLDAALTRRVPGRATPIQFLGLTWGDPARGIDIGRYGKDSRKMFREYTDDALDASMKRVLNLRDPAAFSILLSHHPHALDPAAKAGLPLVLSGHTHGGQIMLTDNIGAGPMRFKYWTGLYKKDNSKLFISNGVGNWFPLRINAPADISHLTLRRSNPPL
jgi:predicted MPP superfamily phosphohydrolase